MDWYHPSAKGVYRDFYDSNRFASLYASDPDMKKNVIFLQLYQDEIQIKNPLKKSTSGKYSTLAFYI